MNTRTRPIVPLRHAHQTACPALAAATLIFACLLPAGPVRAAEAPPSAQQKADKEKAEKPQSPAPEGEIVLLPNPRFRVEADEFEAEVTSQKFVRNRKGEDRCCCATPCGLAQIFRLAVRLHSYPVNPDPSRKGFGIRRQKNHRQKQDEPGEKGKNSHPHGMLLSLGRLTRQHHNVGTHRIRFMGKEVELCP